MYTLPFAFGLFAGTLLTLDLAFVWLQSLAKCPGLPHLIEQFLTSCAPPHLKHLIVAEYPWLGTPLPP